MASSVQRQQQLLQEAMWLNGGRMDAGGGGIGFSISSGELDGDPSGRRWPDQSADPRYSNGYAGEDLSPRGAGGVAMIDAPPSQFQAGGLTLSPSAPSLAPLAGGDAGPALGARRNVLSPLAASAAGGSPVENGRPKTGHRRKQRP